MTSYMWLSFNKHKMLSCCAVTAVLFAPASWDLTYILPDDLQVWREILFYLLADGLKNFPSAGKLWPESILSICPSLHHVKVSYCESGGPPGSHRLAPNMEHGHPARMQTPTADTILGMHPPLLGKLVGWRLTRAHRTLSGRGKGKKNAGIFTEGQKGKIWKPGG